MLVADAPTQYVLAADILLDDAGEYTLAANALFQAVTRKKSKKIGANFACFIFIILNFCCLFCRRRTVSHNSIRHNTIQTFSCNAIITTTMPI
jgi:hypothetical protein